MFAIRTIRVPANRTGVCRITPVERSVAQGALITERCHIRYRVVVIVIRPSVFAVALHLHRALLHPVRQRVCVYSLWILHGCAEEKILEFRSGFIYLLQLNGG